MTELFNGWIDGSVEPEDGCEAVIKWSNIEKGVLAEADAVERCWFWPDGGEMIFEDVWYYLPIPPHDKLMTTGASVLEAGDE